jgi:hypothetical protein
MGCGAGGANAYVWPIFCNGLQTGVRHFSFSFSFFLRKVRHSSHGRNRDLHFFSPIPFCVCSIIRKRFP